MAENPSEIPGGKKVYEIRYDTALSTAYNADFKGRGRLTIDPSGPEFIFEGTDRDVRAPVAKELRLRPADIVEVLADRHGVQIHTPRGESGRQHKRFIFYTRDVDESEAIAAHFPNVVGVRDSEARDFEHWLAQSGSSRPAWATVTHALIALNVLCFAVLVLVFDAGLLIPKNLDVYSKFVANYGPATADGEWWRLFTSMFSHYGVIHLALNMYALFAAGKFLERLQGSACFALTYLGGGLVGDFASILFHTEPILSAGASGAVFAVYGGVLGHFLHEKKSVPKGVFKSILSSLLMFAVYNVAWGLANPNIDQAAHAGGALGGLAFGWLLARPLDPVTRAAQYHSRLLRGWIALTGIFAVGMFAVSRMSF